jgi:4-amino-4-deoxychorismate lyase
MSRLVETIKVENGRILNISLHNERMSNSLFSLFGIKKDSHLESIIEVPSEAQKGIFKCRVVYNDRSMEIEFIPYVLRHVRSLKIVTDDTILYPHKFTQRNRINELFSLRGDCDDILIIKNGMVTDTSYSNVIFRTSGGKWETPDTFLLRGTRRESLLRQELIHEAVISLSDINNYHEMKLINAMLGPDDTEPIPVSELV